jgi:outer membrane protein assembly factor BamB
MIMLFSLDVFAVQFALAVGLFFLINWIGKHSFSIGYVEITLFLKNEDSPAFNYLLRVLTPLVYLLITSTILYTVSLDKFVVGFYRVSVYYILFRLLFNIITQRGALLNWTKQIIYWVSIIALSFIVDKNIISTKKTLFPDFATISNELWIIIIVFLFQILNGLQLSTKGTERRKNAYLQSRYNHFKKKYGDIIKNNTKNEVIQILAYAILIYEDFNRPKISRWMEYLSFFIKRNKHSLGVMQFPTEKIIGDKESVDLGTKKLYSSYQHILNKSEGEQSTYYGESAVLQEIIAKYNGGSRYYIEISSLSETIEKLFYSNTTDTIYPLIPPAEYYGFNATIPHTINVDENSISDINYNPPSILWTKLLGAQKWKNNILIDDGSLFMGSGGAIMAKPDSKDGLYNLDILTGKRKWFCPTSNDFLSILNIDKLVYGGTLDGFFWSISKEHGTPVWKLKFLTAIFSCPIKLSFESYPDLLFVISWKGNAYLIEPEKGTIMFTLNLSGEFRADAVVRDNMIILPEQSGKVYFLKYEYKKLEESAIVYIRYADPYSESGHSNAELYAAPVIYKNTAIIGFARQTYYNHPPIAAIDIYTKKIIWFSANANSNVQTFGNIRSSPCLSGDRLYFANSTTNQLLIISAENGECIGSIDLGTTVYYQWSHPVIEGEILCIARGDGIIYFINKDSNRLLFGIKVTAQENEKVFSVNELIELSRDEPIQHTNPPLGIIGKPFIKDGIIYVGTVDGNVSAIKIPTLIKTVS